MSMISLPQMTAEVFTRRFRPLMFLSMAISAAGCMAGLILSVYIDVPCSALIVIVLAALFASARIASIVASRRRRGGL